MWQDFQHASRASEATNLFVRESHRFPLTARGKTNTYALFAETFRDLINGGGRAGIITPTGIATDATTAPFISDTLRTRRLAAFSDFENEAKIFAGVDHRVRFAVSVFAGRDSDVEAVRFAFLVRHVEDVSARMIAMTPAEVLSLNPNTGTLPIFRTRKDADITLGIYRRHPILIRDGDPNGNPWGLSFKQGLFNMASDSSLFRTAGDLQALGARFDGWAWEWGSGVAAGNDVDRSDDHGRGDGSQSEGDASVLRRDLTDLHGDGTKPNRVGAGLASEPLDSVGHRESRRWVPLYEAKMLSHYNHRFSTYEGATQAQLNVGSLPRLTPVQLNDPSHEPRPRYWVEESEVDEALADRSDRGWLLGWRDITNAGNERAMIPCIFPRSGAGHVFPLALLNRGSGDFESFLAMDSALLLAVWSSLAFDYVTRQSLSGTHLTYGVIKQLACPHLDAFDATFPACLSSDGDHDGESNERCPTTLRDFIIPRVLELTYTSHRMAPFARDLGYDCPPFGWDPDRRALIQAELDAAMMHVYGLTRDEVEHVLDSFPVLRKYEERDHGEFRTRRLVLDFYDCMARSAGTGILHESPIDPRAIQIAHHWKRGVE